MSNNTSIEIVSKDVELYRKIKLSKKRPKLKKLFELTELKPLPFQEKVIDIVDNEYDDWFNLFLLAGRRSSKSTTTAHVCVVDLITPQASVGLVCPTNKQLDVIFNEVLKILRKLNIKPIQINTQQKMFKLENGASFYGVSEKTVEQLEGISLSLLIIDEVFLIQNIDRILESLSPAMLTYGVTDSGIRLAKTIMLGSLRQNRTAYSYYLKGEQGEKGFKSINYKATENPLFTPEMLEQERLNIGDAQFRMQYLNEPVLFNIRSVFYAFDYKLHTFSPELLKEIIDKESYIVGALDVGASDNSSYLLIYCEAGKYYIIDGFEINNVSESKIAEMVKELEHSWGITPKIRYIDPSSKLTRLGLASDYGLVFYPALNAIKESVQIINQLFEQNKLFVSNKMKDFIGQIQNIEWKEGSSTVNRDPFVRPKKGHFDSIASMRYGVFSHFKQYTNSSITVI